MNKQIWLWYLESTCFCSWKKLKIPKIYFKINWHIVAHLMIFRLIMKLMYCDRLLWFYYLKMQKSLKRIHCYFGKNDVVIKSFQFLLTDLTLVKVHIPKKKRKFSFKKSFYPIVPLSALSNWEISRKCVKMHFLKKKKCLHQLHSHTISIKQIRPKTLCTYMKLRTKRYFFFHIAKHYHYQELL